MKIHEVATKTGVSDSAIRFYERVGLIPKALVSRGTNGYRNYTSDILLRIDEIGRMKSAGLDLVQIRKILIEQDYGCDELRVDLDSKILQIRDTISELNKSLEALTGLKEKCVAICNSNNPIDCCK